MKLKIDLFFRPGIDNMLKKDTLKNLPLIKKLLFFSFFSIFIVVVLTAGISFYLQSEQLKDQMIKRVEGLASLWSSTITPADIETAIEFKEVGHPSIDRLVDIVSLINERNSSYIGGYLLEPHINEEGNINVIAASTNYEKMGYVPFSPYNAGEEFSSAFNKSKEKRDSVSTTVYRDPYGLWITAFAPIRDMDGNIIAILGVDVDASTIQEYQKKIAITLFSTFFVIMILVYFFMKWGLTKTMKPINHLMKGINEVSNGNFNVQLNVFDRSDLGMLSERFNVMTNQLSILFERLSATSKELGPKEKPPVNLHFIEEAIGEMENIFQKTKFQQELQRAEKMNAIGQLAASVAHEIRNPMTVVKGFLQIFFAKEHMSEEERLYIKLMIEELNRAETIINDYLSLAKPGIGQSEKIDAGEIGLQVIDLMNSYAMMSKNISIQTNIADHVYVKGSKSELKQVLINIMKNGIEAMQSGGKLELTIDKSEDYGVFLISDTGIGMTPEELKRIGTAFYSLKEKGTGMGLMVCYQIIDRMKGKIEVHSEKNLGTTFKIYIPLFNEGEG